MATISFYAGMDMNFFFASGSAFHDNIMGGTVTTATATSHIVSENGGIREDRFIGTGLGEIHSNMPYAGRVTGWQHYVDLGSGLTKTWDFSGFDVYAPTFSDSLLTDEFGNLLAGVIMANADTVKGSGQADYLLGFAGNDSITGNGGNDVLDGGTGTDMLAGGGGNDQYVVDTTSDVVTEVSGQGTDTVFLAMSASSIYTVAANVENVASMMTVAMTIVGSNAANTLSGANNVSDNLYGLEGNDILSGGAGGDHMFGGAGNDIFYVDSSADVVSDDRDSDGTAGSGTDEVRTSISYSLNEPERLNIENITSVATTGIALTGNGLANIVTGGAGDDILDGGAGADTMKGGAGNDVYFVDKATDKVIENADAGADTVRSTVTFTLGANLETLVLLGTAAINGTGNSLDNTIFGNDGHNVLTGGAGNDTYVVGAGDTVKEAAGAGTDSVFSLATWTLGSNLENLTLIGTSAINGTGNTFVNTITGNDAGNVLNGGAGADTLVGGFGNDTYMVDNSHDTIIELASAGTDLVKSSVTLTLATDVEKLTLTGSGAINGTGNAAVNAITGNSAANILKGAADNDTLKGMDGNDTLYGGTGNDTLAGGTGQDKFQFDAALNASSNHDNITDFNVADDTIVLDQSIFKALTTTGALADAAFFTGSAAHDASDRIIYNKTTGNIYYDADGSGSGAAVLFAHVTAGLVLTHSDFLIVT